MISTSLILAVRGTHVIHQPCIWPSSPRDLRSSVVRASDWCTEDNGFNSCRGFFSIFSMSHTRDMLITSFFISSPSLKFTIFIYQKCSYCFETPKQWLLLFITVVKVLLNLPQITTCGLPSITNTSCSRHLRLASNPCCHSKHSSTF